MSNESQNNCHTIKQRNNLLGKYDSKFLNLSRDAIVTAAAIIKVMVIDTVYDASIPLMALTGVITFASSRMINNSIKKHVIRKKTAGKARTSEIVLAAAQIVAIFLGLGCKRHIIIAIALKLITGMYGKLMDVIEKRKGKTEDNNVSCSESENDYTGYSDPHVI